MKHLNRQRIFVKAIKELSLELGFDVQFISEDWIACLKKDNNVHYVYGYDWDINSAAAQLIAKDKAGTFEILSRNKVDAVEHKLFFNYNLQAKYIGRNGCWKDMMDYVKLHRTDGDYNIVCKPNKGTGGTDTYKISNQLELESTVNKMFSKYRDLCLCPYYRIDNEYRAVFLDGEVLLLYLKERPLVVGNGRDTLSTLIINKYKEEGIGYLESMNGDLALVLQNGEERMVSWKHNLGYGAKAVVVEDGRVAIEMSNIVRQVSKTLGITFASVDIVAVAGKYYVLEVNSGIMVDNFAAQTPDTKYNYYEIAKNIYRMAVKKLFSREVFGV